MKKNYIGVDPGKSGFICIYNHEKDDYSFKPIPLIGKELDIHSLFNIFYDYNDGLTHCVIENVHAVFGSSAGSTFDFGFTCGVLEAILVSCEIPYTKVPPKKWQKEMWQGITLMTKPSKTGKTQQTDTKSMSLLAAKRLFPNLNLKKSERSKLPDHNLVDALLICEYGKRMNL